jgi:hypothetical protein
MAWPKWLTRIFQPDVSEPLDPSEAVRQDERDIMGVTDEVSQAANQSVNDNWEALQRGIDKDKKQRR